MVMERSDDAGFMRDFLENTVEKRVGGHVLVDGEGIPSGILSDNISRIMIIIGVITVIRLISVTVMKFRLR
jgi:hypothetical protein